MFQGFFVYFSSFFTAILSVFNDILKVFSKFGINFKQEIIAPKVYYFIPQRCILCNDKVCELSDISFGDAWFNELEKINLELQ